MGNLFATVGLSVGFVGKGKGDFRGKGKGERVRAFKMYICKNPRLAICMHLVRFCVVYAKRPFRAPPPPDSQRGQDGAQVHDFF